MFDFVSSELFFDFVQRPVQDLTFAFFVPHMFAEIVGERAELPVNDIFDGAAHNPRNAFQ